MNSISLIICLSTEVETRFASTGEENPPKVTSCVGQFIYGYGEKQVRDDISVKAWNGVGETLSQYKAGQALLVNGRIEVVKNNDKTNYELVIEEICGETNFGKYNIIHIAGNLGQDPDMKYFESGASVAKSSLAVNAGKNKTNWFNVEVWSKTAEILANYCHKGDKVGIVGELVFETWNDKNSGELRRKAVVKGNKLSLLGKGQRSEGSSQSDDYSDDF